MKIWNGYGSEHSMNLVMIGSFQEITDADEAKALIDLFREQAQDEPGTFSLDGTTDTGDKRFSEKMSQLMRDSKLYIFHPNELEQFAYDMHIELQGNTITVTTDESDISAFLKLFIEKGARVEVYSAHQYPGTGHGRDTG